MVGSVFSPHYARALQARPQTTSPWAHAALNVALYTPRRKYWALSEYETQPQPRALQLGASRMQWHNGGLEIAVHERTAPWGQALRGTVRLEPQGPAFAPHALHPQRAHHWWPVAPCARVTVQFETPGIAWSGRAYHDVNLGQEPLGRGFAGWHWQRAWHPRGTWVHYTPHLQDGSAAPEVSTLFTPAGTAEVLPAAPITALPRTGWGVQRHGRGTVRELRRLEDTPFYCRSQVLTHTPVGDLPAMHEQVDMGRFGQGWVQFLLPFRIHRG